MGRSRAADAFDEFIDDVMNTDLRIDKHRAYDALTGATDFG